MFLRGCSDHRDQLFCLFEWGGGGVSKGVRPTSRNPFPIYDQNLRFSLPFYDLTKNSIPSYDRCG